MHNGSPLRHIYVTEHLLTALSPHHSNYNMALAAAAAAVMMMMMMMMRW